MLLGFPGRDTIIYAKHVTKDGKTAYVANPVTNDVSAIDIKALKEVARIPVGYVPKRNTTGMLP